MAKKQTAQKNQKTQKTHQKMIEGTIDTPTRRVKKAANDYTEALYEWQRQQAFADESRAKLIELMTADDIERFVLDDTYEITLKKSEPKTKVAVKKVDPKE